MATAVGEGPVTSGRRAISGRFVVAALFGLGIASGIGVYIFWMMHFAPYVPLQKALAVEFDSVRPRVEGGRHRGGPPLLRVVLHVKQAPEPDDPDLKIMAARVRELAATHIDLRAYSRLELYFVHMPPGGRPSRVEMLFPLNEEPGKDR
jgi:hypothetical protein